VLPIQQALIWRNKRARQSTRSATRTKLKITDIQISAGNPVNMLSTYFSHQTLNHIMMIISAKSSSCSRAMQDHMLIKHSICKCYPQLCSITAALVQQLCCNRPYTSSLALQVLASHSGTMSAARHASRLYRTGASASNPLCATVISTFPATLANCIKRNMLQG
jgi:hypothetical protein